MTPSIRRLALTALAALLAAAHVQAGQPGALPGLTPAGVPSTKPDGTKNYPMRRTTVVDRHQAARRLEERRKALWEEGIRSGAKPASPAPTSSGVKGAALAILRMALAQVGTVDLYGSPNYAGSKQVTATCRDAAGIVTSQLCQMDSDCAGYSPPVMNSWNLYPGGATCTGPVVAGTGIRKFVDTLPGLCSLPGGRNNLGNCLPLAIPDTTTFPGNDYYELGAKEFVTRFHSDLPAGSRTRGFHQINTADLDASASYFLGPLVVARSYRPTRLKFTNELPTGPAGDLFIPLDTTLAGAGIGPDGTPYTQNRVSIHLHGGNSPWISDGTQHQWVVPKGEATTHKKGLSVVNVPDMWFDAQGNVIPACAGLMTCAVAGATTDPGDGQETFYWPNEQSGRLLWFHDHSYGITRLNVLAGLAAGYLLANPPDEDALATAGVPGTMGTLFFDPAAQPVAGQPAPTAPDLAHLIPLVIQDRTFVPPPAQLAAQDSSWDTVKWGPEDSLWFPHVYTPNQWLDNPDLSATNPYGRWDYGPYFWPPQQTLTSLDGVARPLTQPCTSSSAVTPANLSGATSCPTTPNPSLVPEAFLDTPIVNGTAYPVLTVDPVRYRFQILNAANDRNFNLSLFVATSIGTAVDSEVQMVEAFPQYLPNYTSYAGFLRAPPACDPAAPPNEVTGLPTGPSWLGLPACYPMDFPSDARQGGVPDPAMAGPRWVQIGTEGGILPAAAVIPPRPVSYELNKRNVVVLNIQDRSLFLGPAERADVVVDFSAYAGKTLILYNDSPAPVPAGDPRQDYFTWGPDLTSQGGAPTTHPGYGPNTRTIMQIKVNAGAPGPALDDAAVATITTALRARFSASQLVPIVPQSVYSNLYAPLATYPNTYLPISTQTLTFTPVGSTAPVTMPFQWKALHELFDVDYGRMNSVLGVELPLTSWLTQTTIPYSNIDPATEFITDGAPALWKITHNGVDTHTIHFHLMNVQVLNRVGWDGQIRPPDANELGWKEVVRMNPLEDIYVALQPVKQHLPWPLPDLIRPLDVDRPLGTRSQFTGVDIYNNPINITNQLVNLGQDYIWHCHLLGHEENDMMRDEVFVVAPEAPSNLVAFKSSQAARKAVLYWQDNSASSMTFTVERDVNPAFPAPVSLTVNAPGVRPGPVSFTDNGPLNPALTYHYRVRAEKVLVSLAVPGASWPAVSAWTSAVPAALAPLAQLLPSSVAFGKQTALQTSAPRAFTLTNVGSAPMTVGAATLTGADPGDFTVVSTTCGATLAVNASCQFNVAFRPLLSGAKAATLSVTTNSAIGPVQSATLTGTGVAPVASVTPTSLVFANQAVGTTSTSRSVTLTNSGTASLSITSIQATGNFNVQAGGANRCGNSLAAGASCNVYVTFTPTAGGTRTGSVVISSTDPVHPALTVVLTGFGTVPPARSVTLSANPRSPAIGGTAVVFRADGAGSTAPYQYRFWLFNGATWTIVQDYSATATWTWNIPLAAAPSLFTVQVDVRTNTNVTREATTSMAYVVAPLPPATGATLVASPAGPSSPGTAVTFTAAGLGALTPYEYEFWFFDGTAWSVVQAWSTTPSWTWTIPAGTTPGSHSVEVWVRTSPWVQFDVTAQVDYLVQ